MLMEHDPAWLVEVEALRECYRAALGSLMLACEHVGSTAVAGLVAKPILDLDLVIADYDAFPAVVAALATLGYRRNGDQGIPGREVFKRDDEFVPQGEPGRVWMAHHLYVCPADSREMRRHVAFREALRGDPELCRRYAERKMELVRLSGGDRKRYAELKDTACRDLVERALPPELRHLEFL